MDFDEWLKFGVGKGWVSYPYCETHDGPPLSEEEYKEYDEGGDPCIVAIRAYV
jgi:hypothetical protein